MSEIIEKHAFNFYFVCFSPSFFVFACVVTMNIFSIGTSAQQLDATFSTSASLEIFELDLSDPSLDMKSCATFTSSHRYENQPEICMIIWLYVVVDAYCVFKCSIMKL